MSNIYATKRPRIQRNKSTIIALALTLTIAATLITGLPFTFGQELAGELDKKPLTGAGVIAMPYTVGINQEVLIWGMLIPMPKEGDVYHDLIFNITKPDDTVDTIIHDSNGIAQYHFYYNCDQVGTYSVKLFWLGDEDYLGAASTSQTWTVQEEATPPLEKIDVYAYTSAQPNPIGVGQNMWIVAWVVPPSPIRGSGYHLLDEDGNDLGSAQGLKVGSNIGGAAVYANFTVTITRPDQTIDIKKFANTLTTTAVAFSYVCGQTGIWSAKLNWPGDLLHNSVESPPVTWTVQEEKVPLQAFPQTPLPTDSWEFPISAENYDWWQISGAWPMYEYDASNTRFNPYTKAPNTAHVLWTWQADKGGLLGGDQGATSIETIGGGGYGGWSRMTQWSPRYVAAHGRLWYTKSTPYLEDGVTDVGEHPVLYCVDQYTGELIYKRHLPGEGSGSTLALEISSISKGDPSIDPEGTMSAFSLWVIGGSTWEVEPWSGEPVWFWERTGTFNPKENAYYITNYNGTKDARESGTMTKLHTRTKRVIWTAKIPSISGIWEDILYRFEHPGGQLPSGDSLQSWNATTGELIADGPDIGYFSDEGGSRDVAYGKLFTYDNDRRMRAISLYTGEVVWASEQTGYPWGGFGTYGRSSMAYGNVYFATYDGYIYCLNAETGKLEWKFYCGKNPETGSNSLVAWNSRYIADGKVYSATGEHTPPNPYPRDQKLFCIDALTGDLVWQLDGFMGEGRAGISSGMLWYTINGYDGKVYMFGKGETATTVEASSKVVAKGASVLIEGTVTDQSPGAKDTPAISDTSMSDWMEYLYLQRPMPSDCEGVSVTLQAMRSDHTVIDIAHVTTDIMGHYEYLWTPPDEDTYKILATFEGSESYWTSSAECGLGVTEVVGPSGPIESEPTANYTIAIIAAVVAVVIIAGVAVWAIRRRK